MDTVSEVLKDVKLQGAMFYNGEFFSPWSVRAPESSTYAAYLCPGAEHVIIFHLVLEGQASAMINNEKVSLAAGDIVIFPHGDPHILQNGPATKTIDLAEHLPGIFANGLKLQRFGEEGEITRIACGYMACDRGLSEVLLNGLPAMIKVSLRNDVSGRWLEKTITHLVDHTDMSCAGEMAVLAKFSELIFIETMRSYISDLPPTQAGWLASARDPEVGKALALMHRSPAQPWTLTALAKEAGVSRSVLAARFRQQLNEPPMAYLKRWRLQLGAQLLSSSNHSVAEVASEVGYESEAAFNR